MTIALHTSSGTPRLSAIAGMTLFLQFWFWHPLIHCLALAFQPTAVIAVNDEIKVGWGTVWVRAWPTPRMHRWCFSQ